MTKSSHMKAVSYNGKPFSMTVKSLPIPTIIQQTDAIIRVTSSGICGSDLHVFHGRLPNTPPMTMGHEVVGIVASLGSLITDIRVGDRVIVSAVLFEDTTPGDAAFGEVIGGLGFGTFPGIDQFNGGQAEHLRVPFASENLLVLPKGTQHELDYVLLADIYPTANWALDCSGFGYGDTVVIFGAGPVGLLAVYSAIFRGANKVYCVDRVPQRLAKAKSLGAIPIDFTDSDPVAQILKLEPAGVDRSCDCVGFECVNAEGVNIANIVLGQAINVTRTGGGIGVVGVYSPTDAGAATADERSGIYSIPVGTAWFKGLTIKGGIVPLRDYQTKLKRLIESGRAKPSFIFDKELRIEDASKAYKQFSDQDFIKSYIKFGTHSKVSDVDADDEVEELEGPEKKRKRNSVAN